MPMLRDNQALIHTTVEGVAYPSVASGWSSLAGGDVTATNTKVFPGGGFPQVSLGGVPTRSDVTVKRPYTPALHAYIIQLENVVGRANMSVSYTPLDANNNPTGGTVTMTGRLNSVKRPDYDATAENPAYLELIMGANVEGSIGQ